ncbi:MAG: tRNA (adenosine(37)-N6)-threonylcarbamoyltransferase complex dimerization subunit type 1 TsaB [Nonlabens sp.]
MLILCIETTSTNCSVALAGENGTFPNSFGIENCIDLLEDQSDKYSHGERLHVFIEQILERNHLTPRDLNAIAISSGPGSYTGLRIGVASAKGLCYSLGIPLIEIDTLTSLSKQAPADNETVLTFLDARRMEVYARVFKNQNPVTPVQAVILQEKSFEPFLNEATVIIGTGTKKFEEICVQAEKITFVETMPSALTMCDLAIQKMQKSDIVTDIAYFEPLYLKEFKAG